MYEVYMGNLSELDAVNYIQQGERYKFVLTANGKKYYDGDRFTGMILTTENFEIAKWYKEKIGDMILAVKQSRLPKKKQPYSEDNA